MGVHMRVAVQRPHLLKVLGRVPPTLLATILATSTAISTGANEANQPRGATDNEAMRRHILSDNRTGADHCPGAHRDAREDDGPRAKRCAITDARLPALPVIVSLQRTGRHDRAWQSIIREYDMRPDEDTILDDAAMIETGVILNLDTIPDAHVGVDEDSFPDDAFHPNNGARPYLCLMPDARMRSDFRTGFERRR
jgi:hypothetical protein